jgi:hypothetical protein
MAKWCAADTDLGFTRDRRSNARKSGKPDLRGPSQSVAVPDQRRTASLRFALHRIRDALPTLTLPRTPGFGTLRANALRRFALSGPLP